ncbi:hypothetical protein [Microbulbifer epialgicus]|uniref:Uncharacterized protein n=1 Tax=Microbulbifer epialgicus TaxID=393907 RepID=A0ABV4P5I0_9GAMM
MCRKLLAILLLTGALPTQAAIVSAVGKIQEIIAYDSFGGGDVLIKFPTQVSNCLAGVYIPPKSEGGEERILSIALSAYMAGKDVRFQIYETAVWPGAANYCKLKTIELK